VGSYGDPAKGMNRMVYAKAGPTTFLRKGGEKDEENQNQTFIQKGSDGKESEPSQADEKVDRAA